MKQLPSYILISLLLIFYACEKDEAIEQETDEQENVQTDTSSNDIDSTEVVRICNGYSELCDVPLNEISFATTHNAHAVQGEFSDLAANQDLTVTQQLDRGIRCLNIKSYWTDDSNCGPEGHYLYHGSATFGCVPLSGFLNDVQIWMEQNPYELVLFTIEPGASVLQLDQSFNQAGLSDWMYQHTFGEPWPTLGELLSMDKRLVVFTNKGNDNSNYEGFHDYWNYTFDTDYRAQSRTDFECDKDRGNASGDFFLLNHFLTQLTPQYDSAATINEYTFLLNRAQNCGDNQSKKPNFIMVDFAGEGDVVQVVNMLNGLE